MWRKYYHKKMCRALQYFSISHNLNQISFSQIGKFIYNNLDEFIRDTYASHVFRTLLETFSGVQVKESIKSSRKLQTNHAFCHDAGQILRIPPDLQSILNDIMSRLFMLPDLPGRLFLFLWKMLLHCNLHAVEYVIRNFYKCGYRLLVV